MSAFDLLSLVVPALALASGLVMLLAPRRFQRHRSRRSERRLAARLERGQDACFEELRELQSYGRPLDPRTVRFFGALLATASALVLALKAAEIRL